MPDHQRRRASFLLEVVERSQTPSCQSNLKFWTATPSSFFVERLKVAYVPVREVSGVENLGCSAGSGLQRGRLRGRVRREGSDCCSCTGKWRGTLGLPRDQLAATDALCPHRTCAAPRVVIRTGQPEPLGGDRLASGCPVQAATLHVKLMKRCPLLSRERSVNPCTRFMRPFCL